MIIKRMDIYLATLDPIVGREISKTRPVVVVSNDINNLHAGTVTVLPLTSQRTEPIYPFEVLLVEGAGNLPKTSKVKADQIRTLDKSRMVKYIGSLAEIDMQRIDQALKIHLALGS